MPEYGYPTPDPAKAKSKPRLQSAKPKRDAGDDLIDKTLTDHSEKQFVQRILRPNDFPSLDLGGGAHASHRMAWAEVDGRNVVYPTVVQRGDELVELDEDTAIRHALQSGEFIEFGTPDEADFFSREYKRVWKR